ncbi:hypothetical protein DFH08DRAFT_387258 [Mycena albidolilacea]|uniref:DUF6534 domain-containing protein n=1 Tax=Mycena albidolilacea TaxID=1033008 RepID=A0AAD7EFX6_9AGAR|nr:hypothetical protein DFH08DRAFT_387258 [Mycena albidolilacea]
MSSPSTQPTFPTVFPDYSALVTSQLIGSLLHFFFFGTLLIQVYVYRLCFPKDFLGLKFVVYFIFLAMLVCTCLIAADLEYWFGSGYGDISRFADPRNSRFYNPLMGSLIGMIVQLFFAYRIFAMKRAAWPLALLTGLIALAQCAGGMGAGIVSYMDGNMVHDSTRTALAHLWLIAGAVVNILIAGTMTFLLTVTTPPAPGIVKNAVRMVIETNNLTTVAALVGLILFFACPNTTYWVCPTMVLPGMYANTLLVTLNNRAVQRTNSPEATKATVSFSPNGTAPRASAASTMHSRAPLTRSSTVYSTNGVGRVLSVPAMSFARREDAQSEKSAHEKRPRNSVEREWRDGADADSDSEYESEGEGDHEGAEARV